MLKTRKPRRWSKFTITMFLVLPILFPFFIPQFFPPGSGSTALASSVTCDMKICLAFSRCLSSSCLAPSSSSWWRAGRAAPPSAPPPTRLSAIRPAISLSRILRSRPATCTGSSYIKIILKIWRRNELEALTEKKIKNLIFPPFFLGRDTGSFFFIEIWTITHEFLLQIFWPQSRGFLLYPEILLRYIISQQRIRIIVGDAGFEHGTSTPEVWCQWATTFHIDLNRKKNH